MKKIRKTLSLLLCIVLVLCNTLSSFADSKDESETTDSKIVEQLKEDLGEEKADEILNSLVATDSDIPDEEFKEDIEYESDKDYKEELGEEPEEESEISNEDSSKGTDEENVAFGENDFTGEESKVGTMSEIDENLSNTNKSKNKKLKLFSATGNSYTLTNDWANGSGIAKSDVTKLTFEKGGSLPSGTEYTIDSSSGLKGYVDGTEITIYVPDVNDTIYAPEYSGSLFSSIALIQINNLNYLDTSNVTDMQSMFSNCKALTSLNLSNFDTTNVTNMSYMFMLCNALTSLDVSNFDTSNVTKMDGMFNDCKALASLDVSNFNTSNVVDMNRMFMTCEALTSLNLSSFDTSKVMDMECMFSFCKTLTLLNLSNFSTSNVTNMGAMFYGCNSIASLDVSNFDTSKVTDMSMMFSCCQGLTEINLANFDTSNVTNFKQMFYWDFPLATIYVSSSFTTLSATNSDDMFNACSNIVGGAGTTYDSTKIDKTYARIDTTSMPGYFTEGSVEPTVTSITVNTKPTKLIYNVGDNFDPAGLKIKLNYSDSTYKVITYTSNNASDFSFSPSGALSIGANIINVTYGGKSISFGISVTGKPSNSDHYNGGGSSSDGGSASDRGISISSAQGLNTSPVISGTTNTQATAKVSQPRVSRIEKTANNLTSTWIKNVDGSWGLNSNGVVISNGFLVMTTINVVTTLTTKDIYHFDETGKMTVGWLKDTNGAFYFFEDAKTKDEGKMCFGWKQMVTREWYYFGIDGKMLTNQITPDGYMVNADGSWNKQAKQIK